MRHPFALLTIAGLLLGGAGSAAAQTAAPPTMPAVPPAAAAPSGTAAGLCQCHSDRKALRFSCLGSAQQCQAACGTTRYSFVPDAALSCPGTATAAAPTTPPGQPAR